MPIRILIALFGVLAGVFLYLAWSQYEESWAIYSIPCVIAFAVLLSLKPQFEWWYYKRNPKDIPPGLRRVFEERLPDFYQRKSQNDKLLYRKRVFLTHMGIAFRGQGFEDDEIPVDVTTLIASQAARVMENTDRYVLEPFETVVLYKHPFPSPAHPDYWHSSELFEEDGALLFNLENAIPGILLPRKHFNIVLYEWFRVANRVLGRRQTSVPDGEWQTLLAKTANLPPSWVQEAIGLPEVDGNAVKQVILAEFGQPKLR
jgi:hypothetical protein